MRETFSDADCSPTASELAALLVSELATNVVRHARSESLVVEVVVDPEHATSRVAVHDEDPRGDLRPHRPADCAESGRGLFLIESLSDAWGVEISTEPPSKVVWFELPCKTREWQQL